MKPFPISFLTAAALLSSSLCAAQAPDFSVLAEQIEHLKKETQLPSATAIAVIKDGAVIYEGYFGYADIAQQKRATHETSFYIASATKPFFALSMLLKESRGTLSTNTSLQQAFPSLTFHGIDSDSFDAKTVTVKDLLTHTSGVENNALVWATAMSGIHDANTRLRMVAGSIASKEAGHGNFRYTNVGYNILSVWLEQAHATSWQQQVKETVLTSLSMTHSSPYISEAQAKGWQLAKPYSALSSTPHVALYLEKTDLTMQAAGGIIATAPNLANFLIAQLEQGKLAGKQVLPAEVIAKSQHREASTDANYMGFNRDGYAWGWYTGNYKAQRMLHHFGAFAGFHAHLSFMPEKRLGLVVLNNEDFLSARFTDLIADHVYSTLLGDTAAVAGTPAKFDALLEKAKGLPQGVTTEQQKIQGRAFVLTQPLAQYAGRYNNELLGELTVAITADQKLVIRWGKLTAIATGFEQANTVRVELVPNSGELLKFEVSDGAVTAVKLEDLVFRRIE